MKNNQYGTSHHD